MLDEAALLQEIRTNPDDAYPRLMLADWFEEHGDPRAQLIRIQWDLAECPLEDSRWADLVKQEARLVSERRRILLKELAPLGVRDIRFALGFVDRILIEGSRFLNRPRTLFGHAPCLSGLMLRRLDVTESTACVQRLVERPELAGLRAIDLAGCHLSGAAALALATSVFASGLEKLNLANNRMSGQGIQALVSEESQLKAIQFLHLGENDLGQHDLHALSKGRILDTVNTLRLPGNRMGDDAFRRLTHAESCRSIRSLDVSRNELGPGAILDWSESRALDRLEEFSLSGNPIGNSGISRLSNSSHAANLRILDLADCELDSAALQNLSSSEYLPNLRTLVLSGNPVGQDLSWLGPRSTGALDRLDLARTGLRSHDVIDLLSQNPWPNLVELDLSDNPIDDQLFPAFFETDASRHLQTLNLASTAVTEFSARALLRFDSLPALRRLCIRQTKLANHAELRERLGNRLDVGPIHVPRN